MKNAFKAIITWQESKKSKTIIKSYWLTAPSQMMGHYNVCDWKSLSKQS